MLRTLLGIAPQKEPDGSFRPSKLALKLATSDTTDYEPVAFVPYDGERNKILVLFTEQKNMEMKNGKLFSTGNHPVEALVPMLHLRNAGFEFEVATPTGKPVAFEMWAMPKKDAAVLSIFDELKADFDSPRPLPHVLENLEKEAASCAAVFVPGGHGAMLGIPEDNNVSSLLRWAHDSGRFTISLCHGPGSLLATSLGSQDFIYQGYNMAVFPDAIDKQTPMIGYLPGHMPWQLGAHLESLGVNIVNAKGDDTCCIDRRLITGASPAASNKLGKLAATTLLQYLNNKEEN